MSGRKNATIRAVRENGKAASPALARSVSLHLEGKRKEALRETEYRHRERRGIRRDPGRQGPHPVRAGTIRRRRQDLREGCIAVAPQPPHGQLQPGHLL